MTETHKHLISVLHTEGPLSDEAIDLAIALGLSPGELAKLRAMPRTEPADVDARPEAPVPPRPQPEQPAPKPVPTGLVPRWFRPSSLSGGGAAEIYFRSCLCQWFGPTTAHFALNPATCRQAS